MFAAGGKKGKGADKEGAARFKKDIITYKNQALQPVSALQTNGHRREEEDSARCNRNFRSTCSES